MRYPMLLLLAGAGTLAVSTAGPAQQFPVPNWSMQKAEQAAGQRIFADHCAACHAHKTAPHVLLAPSLKGVVGKPAGTNAKFPYSNELKKSGIVWTEDKLRQWVADPAHLVPNTLMPHVGISDPAEQIYLVAYLKTLSPLSPK